MSKPGIYVLSFDRAQAFWLVREPVANERELAELVGAEKAAEVMAIQQQAQKAGVSAKAERAVLFGAPIADNGDLGPGARLTAADLPGGAPAYIELSQAILDVEHALYAIGKAHEIAQLMKRADAAMPAPANLQ